jgi:uncharacterized protein YbaP (TraB family)
MKRHKRSDLVLVLFLFALNSLTPAFHTSAMAAERGSAKHCLWKVQGKKNTLYLLGSVHLLQAGMYPLDKPIEEAYRQASIVVFETDVAKMSSPEFQMKMLTEGQYPPGDSLKNHLSSKTYSLLHKHVQEAAGIGTAFDRFKPWMAAIGLLGIELAKLGYEATNGVDRHFLQRAERDSKKVIPLETPEFQIGLFKGFTKAEEDQFVLDTITHIGELKASFKELVETWRTGDLKGLDKIVGEHLRAYPSLHKKLLLDRNKNWIPKITELMDGSKKALVIVGAAHLIGKGSVVELLQKKGYKIEQL